MSSNIDIPVIIISFNNYTYLINMINQLSTWIPLSNIWIFDNCSTYHKTVNFLNETKCKVIKTPMNLGPRAFMRKKYWDQLPQYFAVTDPDLQLNPLMPKDSLFKLLSLTTKYHVFKAGLAIDISPDPDFNNDLMSKGSIGNKTIYQWEQRFWKRKLGILDDNPIYLAYLDTTFAVYNKSEYKGNFLQGVRVAGNYTCKHLPWYKTSIVPQEELDFYKNNTVYSVWIHK